MLIVSQDYFSTCCRDLNDYQDNFEVYFRDPVPELREGSRTITLVSIQASTFIA